jgi:hypothetical protein
MPDLFTNEALLDAIIAKAQALKPHMASASRPDPELGEIDAQLQEILEAYE